ncbi:MAG: hypothetical protein E6Q58_02795 [Niabella sp.]|nr:MAG: hypothetical protein E6Q58_02795 [Niabella sp.]
MKKIVIALAIICASFSSKSQFVTLADQDFALLLMARYPGCFSGFQLDTTCSEIVNEQFLYLIPSTATLDGIENLDGLQYFKSLVTLEIEGTTLAGGNYNEINFIPLLSNTIRNFRCSSTVITSLPPIPDSLRSLRLYQNDFLTTFPSFPDKLEILDCIQSNGTIIIPNLPNSITYIRFSGLSSLTFSQPKFPDSLKHAQVVAQNVNSFPELNDSISYLWTGWNSIDQLNEFPNGLDTLIIAGNALSPLPQLPSNLKYLQFFNTTNLYCLPHLPPMLAELRIPVNVQCLPNTVVGLQVFQQLNQVTLPLCNPVNNPNHCVAMPVITGRLFYDLNSNGIKEASENYRSNVEAYTNSGVHSFTNDSGYFELSGDTGLNVLNIVNPPFYIAVPAGNSYSLNSFDTLVSNTYALQPQVNVDSISISLARTSVTRPGFICSFRIEYENVGTTSLPANITLTYNPSHLSYQNASIPGVTNNGSRVTIPVINLDPGEQGSINLTFMVLLNSPLGDTTYLNAQATAGTSVTNDSIYSVITGSFDPNDKNATPKLTPQQVTTGTFINYLLRFQNTGSDTAINVVVTDTLDAQLDVSSFQLISTSHTGVVKRDGRNLSFEFINIMLPDSNVNEPLSHGYVRFRVKPLTSVLAGSIIHNAASIYFDYNIPVVTNTTTTTVEAIVVPLTLLSFDAQHYENNKALLRWATAQEISTLRFEIDRSHDGRNFTYLGTVAASGNGDHYYSFITPMHNNIVYYRLKMIDVDGRFSYSETKKLKMLKEREGIIILKNPSSNVLTFNCLNTDLIGTNAIVFDSYGRKIREILIGNSIQSIDIASLSAGIYYLKTFDGIKQFIVTHY